MFTLKSTSAPSNPMSVPVLHTFTPAEVQSSLPARSLSCKGVGAERFQCLVSASPSALGCVVAHVHHRNRWFIYSKTW